ncbi:hypothetical protein AGJ34_21215 [Cronobacter dublinensis subsp. dublinensis]|nr:hypothetical protein [Cronobacter dublinensis subsp. dublinensis]EGT5729925.1 hypothetical protein [Cronobacter dublinensis subsp. dublinensis]
MTEMIEVIDAFGVAHKVTVMARFSHKINGHLLGFVVHKSLSIRRMVLSHEKSGTRIGVLNGGDIQRLGIEGAGLLALRQFVDSAGEIRAADVLLAAIPARRLNA